MSEGELNDLPATSAGDRLHALVRGILGGVPYAGGLAAEIFGLLVVSPYQRRLHRWIEAVGEQLRALEDRQAVDLVSLSMNDVFVSTLMQATQAAVRTHREEKIELLRRAVLAAANDFPATADQQSVFIRYIDELTPTHFRLLGFIADNENDLRDCDSYQDLLAKFISAAGAALSPDEFRLLCNDLGVRLLVRFSGGMGDSTDAYRPSTVLIKSRPDDQPMLRVTDVGRDLIGFVGASNSGGE